MSYILAQDTAYKEMPVGTDWVYSVIDTNYYKYKFKYIVQIYGGSTGTTYLGKFKFSANGSGYGIIKIDDILEQYMSSDNLGSIYTGIESAFKGVDNLAGSECPIHCIDKLSLNTSSAQILTLKFGSEFASTPNVAPTEYLSQLIISDLFTFNGVSYNNEDKYVSGDYGIDLQDWNNYSYYPTSTSSRLLTDAPITPLSSGYGQFIGDNDYATLAFLSGDFSNAHPQPDRYDIQFFDAAGSYISQINTDITSANGGADLHSPIGLLVAEVHLQYIGVGPANFKGAGFSIPGNWNSYKVFLVSSLYQCSQEYSYFKQDADCKGFEKIRLTWLNKYGVWDYYNFTKKNTSSTNINRTSFNKVKGNWNEPRYVKHGYQRGSSTLNNSALQTMSLNSDWFRNDEEAAWLEQLFISPEVYIIKQYDAFDTAPAEFGNYMIPVTVTNKSYDKLTEANDKVAQYNLDIEYAIDKRIQRG
tara:strand:- start:2133 stop:3548 length:1416 start_codon:yes stop_codon:yes gene_type:complete